MSGYFFPFGIIAGQFKKLFGDKKKVESTRRRSEGAKRGWELRRQREQGLPLPMEHNPPLNERPEPDQDRR